jgi:hypothetical protein
LQKEVEEVQHDATKQAAGGTSRRHLDREEVAAMGSATKQP